jgi:two-component system, cell cycle sensor histidine kinase and response regulator CckA
MHKGYNVLEAIDGEDAIQKFMEHKDLIDLLILDVVMPKKNGKEVYIHLRVIKPNIKALFTSGYTGDVVIDKGIYDDTVDFISEPLSPNGLLLKAREVLDK